MKFQKRVFILLLFMILISSPLYMSSFAKNNKIELGSNCNQKYYVNNIADLEIKSKFKIVDELLSPQTLSTLNEPNKNTFYIIQFKSALNDSLKIELEKNEVKFYNYIPDNSYLVKISNKQKESLLEYPQVNWIGLYQPQYKLDSSLLEKEGKLLLILDLFDNSNKNKIQKDLENLGATIIENSNSKFKIFIDSSKLLDIATIDDIMLIEEYQYPTILNDIARGITNVNYVWDNLGLFGQGQVIAIADTGIDTGLNDASMHDDFQGRILDIINMVSSTYSPDDNSSDMYSGHGTHVAGIALGNGNLSGSIPSSNFYNQSFAGVAPKSSLYFQSVEGLCSNITSCGGAWNKTLLFTPLDLYNLFQPAYDAGIRIHSNSWGANYSSEYTTESVNTDSFIWDNSDMTILFAAGNKGVAYEIYSPGTAKNVITVGALDDVNTIASYSSIGPTVDGRIKPDLVAPGSNIISTRSSVTSETLWGNITNPNYLYSGGTSMATPHVAGIVALVREHFNKSLNYSTPSAALIKASLINGAKNVSGPRPDFEQGWGMVDLKNSILPDTPRQIFYFDNTSGLTTGEHFIFDFDIELDTSNPLKITLVWTDYPGSALSGVNLVNDLDLTLNGPQNNIYFGNDFSAPYNTSYDTINNVEQIDILNPILGRYQLDISGSNIVNGPQPFAVVISYGKYAQQMNVIEPVHNKIYDISNISIDVNYLGPGTINYSFDGGITKLGLNSSNGGLSFDSQIFTFLDGDYTLDLYAKNQSGFLTDHETIEFNIETGPLNISSMVPKQDQTYSAYNFTLKSNLGERGYLNFTLDGGITNYSMNSSNLINYNYSINLANGNYTIDYYAQDLVGNVNDTYQINFSIDKIIPTITINSPQNITHDNSNLNISVTLNEQGYAWYNLYGTNISLATSDNLSFTSIISNINDSYYTIYFYAKDMYENYVYKNISFGIDNITLNISSYSNVSPINVTKLQVPINIIFSKNISNIYYVQDGFSTSLNDDLNANILTTNIDIYDYQQTSITLTYNDYFSNTKNTIISITPNLFLNGTITDFDNDSIIDAQDSINGNINNINNNLNNLSIYVNSSNNISKIFNSVHDFKIKENGNIILEMANNFSANKLDLTNITIKKDSTTNSAKLYVKGLQLETGNNKTLYLKLSGTNTSFSSLCIKDANILDFSQISSACSLNDEIYIHSIPYNSNNYSIAYVDMPSRLVKISGLKHSGIAQTCTEDWTYTDWGSCSGGFQGRTAIDQNSCGTIFQRDILSRACVIVEVDSETSSSTSSSDTDDVISEYVPLSVVEVEEQTNFAINKPKTSIMSNYEIYLNSQIAKYDTNYTGTKKVYIKDRTTNSPIIFFDYDFSKSNLDLSKLEIHRGNDLDRGYILIAGLDLDTETKTAKINTLKNSKKVCVKDLEVEDISEVSIKCDGVKEYVVECDGKKTKEGYTCFLNDQYYSISGLKHSAIIEYVAPLVKEVVTNIDNSPKYEEAVKAGGSNLSLSETPNEGSNFWKYFFGFGLAFLAVFIIW